MLSTRALKQDIDTLRQKNQEICSVLAYQLLPDIDKEMDSMLKEYLSLSDTVHFKLSLHKRKVMYLSYRLVEILSEFDEELKRISQFRSDVTELHNNARSLYLKAIRGYLLSPQRIIEFIDHRETLEYFKSLAEKPISEITSQHIAKLQMIKMFVEEIEREVSSNEAT